jgi:hypothetical protein
VSQSRADDGCSRPAGRPRARHLAAMHCPRSLFDCFSQALQLLSIMPWRFGSDRQISDNPKDLPAMVEALAGANNVRKFCDSHRRIPALRLAADRRMFAGLDGPNR